MEKDLVKIENRIAQEVLAEMKKTSGFDSQNIDELIISKINKADLFVEDWQAHYSKERILQIILETKYGSNAGKYYHIDKKINKNKYLLYPLIGWLPGLILFGDSKSDGVIGGKSFLRHFKGLNFLWNFLMAFFPSVITFGIISAFIMGGGFILLLSFGIWMIIAGVLREKIATYLKNENQKEGRCPHCQAELIFEQSDLQLGSVVCPTCSKKFNITANKHG